MIKFTKYLFLAMWLTTVITASQEALNNELIETSQTKVSNISKIKDLLDKGACVNALTAAKETPLHLAIFYGHQDIVKLLLVYGADCNNMSTHGNTPLALASYMGHKDIVELLLEHGADPDPLLNKLIEAGRENNISKVRELLDYPPYTPLFWASFQGYTHIVKLLLERGANPNTACGWFKLTPLMEAVRRGHKNTVKLLLDKGAKPNIADKSGKTSVYRAVAHRDKDILKMILENIDTSDKEK